MNGYNKQTATYDETRRERLKSALYLRLKKRKVLKICSGLLLKFNQITVITQDSKNVASGLFYHPTCCKMLKQIQGTLWRQKFLRNSLPEKNSKR